MEYPSFAKIPRLHKPITVTEKLDGTNGLVAVFDKEDRLPEGLTRYVILPDRTAVAAGSRHRWLTPDDDNHGFARWVWAHAEELAQMGPGLHYGEWWGGGINRGYGFTQGEKHFSLFNVGRWGNPEDRPDCCELVPILASGAGDQLNESVTDAMLDLMANGSTAQPGYMRPEGVVVWHSAANQLFKVTFDSDTSKFAQVYNDLKGGATQPAPGLADLANLFNPPWTSPLMHEMAPA